MLITQRTYMCVHRLEKTAQHALKGLSKIPTQILEHKYDIFRKKIHAYFGIR